MATSTPAVILVTGSSGLVGKAIEYVIDESPKGSWFAGRANEKWIYATSATANLTDLADTKRLFAEIKPTHVIHLAAKVGGLFANMAAKSAFLEDNLQINSNVLAAAHSITPAPKVISCLSTCVFPDKTPYPIDETMVHLGPPHHSNFGYAYAKRMVDIQNHAYHEQYQHLFTSAIPTNIFGPHDNYDLENAHVIPALIHKAFNDKTFGVPLKVLGNGEPLRQFIYSRDLAKLFIWMTRRYDSVEPLILSVDEKSDKTIGDVARCIMKEVGIAGEPNFTEKPSQKMESVDSNGQQKKTASNAKLVALLAKDEDVSDFQFTPFEQAMKETVAWFEENYNKDPAPRGVKAAKEKRTTN